MDARSHANGNGPCEGGSDMRMGSPVPFYMRTPAVLDARATSTTFWDLL
jgi:hypothetical protein